MCSVNGTGFLEGEERLQREKNSWLNRSSVVRWVLRIKILFVEFVFPLLWAVSMGFLALVAFVILGHLFGLEALGRKWFLGLPISLALGLFVYDVRHQVIKRTDREKAGLNDQIQHQNRKIDKLAYLYVKLSIEEGKMVSWGHATDLAASYMACQMWGLHEAAISHAHLGPDDENHQIANERFVAAKKAYWDFVTILSDREGRPLPASWMDDLPLELKQEARASLAKKK